MLFGDDLAWGRKETSLRPFVEDAMLEKPVVAALYGVNLAALRYMAEFIRVHVHMCCGLFQVEHFMLHRIRIIPYLRHVPDPIVK